MVLLRPFRIYKESQLTVVQETLFQEMVRIPFFLLWGGLIQSQI